MGNLATNSVPISDDAYVSFQGPQRRRFGEPRRRSPLVFIDLDTEDVTTLRTLPRDLIAQRTGLLLIRPKQLDGNAADLIAEVAAERRQWGINQPIAVLKHPLGQPAQLIGLDRAIMTDEQDWVRRARAIELEALLEFGEAIWRPNRYHYRLITGEHAPSYVKLADAIRTPRDARVLASWLLEHVEENCGLLLDSGTLIPLAQAIELEAMRAGVQLGNILVVDPLTRNSVDTDALVDRAMGPPGRLLAVVSVSSSNSLVGRLLATITRRGKSLNRHAIAVLISKSDPADMPAGIDVWTPVEPGKALLERGSFDDYGCKLCRTPGKAAVVPISPLTFDAMQPAQLQSIVPSIDDPASNRSLWEALHRNRAIEIEADPVQTVASHRSDKVPMGIKLVLPRLLRDERWKIELRRRIVEARKERGFNPSATLVLVPAHERSADAFDQFWADVGGLLAQEHAQVVPFEADGDFDELTRSKVQAADSVLVFVLGAVTGGTVQRALVGIQDARKTTDEFQLQGFVVHARPATTLELRTLRNSYGRDGDRPVLHFAWASVLPDRSPLREEGRLLRLMALDNSQPAGGPPLSPQAKAFVAERLKLCDRPLARLSPQGGEPVAKAADKPPTPDAVFPLWGDIDRAVLTPNSIYGRDLDVTTTYVAVGSAMAAGLGRLGNVLPELRVFDLPAMMRSYYDPIILSCFLRWMRPHEAFWGWTSVEAQTTVHHAMHRAEGAHRTVIVPELLLAAAHGKLTLEAATVAASEARLMLEDSDLSAVHACLEVGLAMLELAELPPTEGPQPSLI